ncbi:dUTP diphosphatase [Limnoraphis robusta Tam1]|uniref:Deoxyuridine 5'-triphosphate nucleotidohydrolase n=1 Tax=Limnoraphis robusta CCNP1315 TaxID=3110306 RepID=A0ABU5U1G6_9CYAN|nr:dUTP diphosphatase [Limnoraphis robusta]MEA5495591.1 dUTP diphosphatase [Limnoraphis robusta BA-68 BA1]MEA5520885.1 dUTP diphosphatase [Limnoraphis robusta CCNP1315]MEA5538137.1 dUTP diphosphatase [Limnoraphis robusta Tam1]MEA5545879.1 dUTP diphosphatase [Limnoraphis robusta CCNP1324]
MKIKILRLNEAAILPKYAHPNDAGLDLYSIEDQEILPGESKLIHTGISIELSPGTEAQIRPRSGLALKHQITVLNTPGTIDADYRGEIGVILINHGKTTFNINKGMKIAQLVIAPVIHAEIEEVQQLNSTIRGDNGFGSSGV